MENRKINRIFEEFVKSVKILLQVSNIMEQKYAFPAGPFFEEWHMAIKFQLLKTATVSHLTLENVQLRKVQDIFVGEFFTIWYGVGWTHEGCIIPNFTLQIIGSMWVTF